MLSSVVKVIATMRRQGSHEGEEEHVAKNRSLGRGSIQTALGNPRISVTSAQGSLSTQQLSTQEGTREALALLF